MATGESAAIGRVKEPATRTSLASELRQLGIRHGDVVLVHSSLKALGWVVGGPQAVVLALYDAVGESGTIVMPTQTDDLSDPAEWSNPPVPKEWHQLIRDHLPAFDVALTPTRGMGRIVECFRADRGTIRSTHPAYSFAARGPQAQDLMSPHALAPGFGEVSPLGRLYQADAKVLLLGASYAANTSFHLAEHRASWPSKRVDTVSAPIERDGQRIWHTYEDLGLGQDDFEAIGAALQNEGLVHRGAVGIAEAELMSMVAIVDFAVGWIPTNRT